MQLVTVMTAGSDLAGDAEKLRALRRMKLIPLVLLGVSALILLVAWHFAEQPGASGVWGFVRAGAEAAMVGGLADWFAVTALFRHPMGIPIPHTALIPNKKDQLGASLGSFVQQNFLNEEVVRAKVATARPALRLGDYLANPTHRAWLIGEAAEAGEAAINSLRDSDVQNLIRSLLFRQAAAYQWGPPAGRLLSAVTADRSHVAAIDALFRVAHDWMVRNEDTIVALVADRGPAQGFFLARAAHEAVGRRVHNELCRWLADALADPDHRARAAIDTWLSEVAVRLREDPELIAKVEDFKAQTLASAEVQAAVASVWPATKQVLLAALADPDGELRSRADQLVLELADRLRTDDVFRARVDRRICDGAIYLSSRYGAEATSLISDTVARWDATEASRRIELQVGKDLQYIRVNGTVVGALAGVVIYGVGLLLLG